MQLNTEAAYLEPANRINRMLSEQNKLTMTTINERAQPKEIDETLVALMNELNDQLRTLEALPDHYAEDQGSGSVRKPRSCLAFRGNRR